MSKILEKVDEKKETFFYQDGWMAKQKEIHLTMRITWLESGIPEFLFIFIPGFSLRNITTSISSFLKLIPFQSNCTFEAGEIRLLFYSPSANATQVRLDGPKRVPLNPSWNTVFLVHGFLSDSTRDWVNDTIAALLKDVCAT